MTDTIREAAAHERVSADTLDDPDDLENRAILHWLQTHVAFQYHHHRYALVTESIPDRWRKIALPISDKSSAAALFPKHDPIAMAGLRRAYERLGTLQCVTDKTVIDGLAAALATRRAWLFEDAKKPDLATKTDPAIYRALNGALGTNVAFAALSDWEGDQKLRGYVPFSKGITAGRSGMTIATGFDIGQLDKNELARYGLPVGVVPRFMPYAKLPFSGMTRAQVAAVVARTAPVPIVTKPEADAIDKIVHQKHLAAAVQSWNAKRAPGVPQFQALPSAWQTVLFSRTFHQGPGMPTKLVARLFYTAATSGHWARAADALQNYAVSDPGYRRRVAQEAALLRTEFPPPLP